MYEHIEVCVSVEGDLTVIIPCPFCEEYLNPNIEFSREALMISLDPEHVCQDMIDASKAEENWRKDDE